jgi:glutamine cyclotransferase
VKLPDDFFAEGADILDGKIYQLTWLENKCFVYDAATLEKVREFAYDGEGWGLTTDGTKLYMSDGTANIAVRNPDTFRIERTFAVLRGGKPVEYINELEWIDGRIWANVYTTEEVLIINPETGTVEGSIDFRGLISELTITSTTDVMNGIARDAATGKIYVTGKNWDKLFEVEIFKK